MQSETVQEELDRIGFSAGADTLVGLTFYVSELERWNRRVNLTALHGLDLVRRLIIEPIWIGRELQMSGELADVGSGNGSPAIPLCLTRQFKKVHMVEARTKRAAFLRHVVTQLGLPQVTVHKSRLEELSTGLVASQWITLQAVAATHPLLSSLKHFVSSTTQIVWITSGRDAPMANARRLRVPDSKTEVWVFSLDQS